MLDPLTLFGLAVGLAMDAFAVSIAMGISLPRVRTNQALRLALAFGGFQFLMPVVGYLAGKNFSGNALIVAYDHWIAFALLAALGLKMIRDAHATEADDGDPGDDQRPDPTKSPRLIVLALATSIDALAVGLSLAFLRVTILLPSTVIGLVAAGFAVMGIHLGHRFGHHLERRAEAVGGVALIAIGLRILIDHLWGAAA